MDVVNRNPISILIIGIIVGLIFLIGGIYVLINYYKKYNQVEGKCIKTWYSLKNKISVVEYFVNNEKYEMQKHIPFSEEGYNYKLKIHPTKHKKALCWYDAFLSYECIFLGILIVVVSIIDVLK